LEAFFPPLIISPTHPRKTHPDLLCQSAAFYLPFLTIIRCLLRRVPRQQRRQVLERRWQH
jgi:hypothetical protein